MIVIRPLVVLVWFLWIFTVSSRLVSFVRCRIAATLIRSSSSQNAGLLGKPFQIYLFIYFLLLSVGIFQLLGTFSVKSSWCSQHCSKIIGWWEKKKTKRMENPLRSVWLNDTKEKWRVLPSRNSLNERKQNKKKSHIIPQRKYQFCNDSFQRRRITFSLVRRENVGPWRITLIFFSYLAAILLCSTTDFQFSNNEIQPIC